MCYVEYALIRIKIRVSRRVRKRGRRGLFLIGFVRRFFNPDTKISLRVELCSALFVLEAIIIARGSHKYPDKQSVIAEIRRRYNDGLPVNYSAIRVQDDALRKRCTALFGGYKYAVESSGYDYDKFRIDTNTSAYYGIVFEELVNNLFSELRVEYGESGSSKFRPDIVLRYKRWVDVKLSEWTVDNRDCPTVNKYLPQCRSLTIVYLRGRKGERMYNDKVRLINVREYVKQLPRSKRGYFYEQINDIETNVNGIESY